MDSDVKQVAFTAYKPGDEANNNNKLQIILKSYLLPFAYVVL